MEKKKKVLIVDQQYLITRSLEQLLSEKFSLHTGAVVRSLQDLEEVLVVEPDWTLMILDPELPDLENPSALQPLISELKRKIPILVLTASLTRNELSMLNSWGIRNIIFKNAEEEEIIRALQATLSGKKFYGQEVLDLLTVPTDGRKANVETVLLTQSEIEIVRLIAEGRTTKEIADKKNVSFHTIMTHRKNIFRKARVNNASELVMYGIRNGIIDVIDYQI